MLTRDVERVPKPPPPVPDKHIEVLLAGVCYHLADSLGADDVPVNLRRHLRRALVEIRDSAYARGKEEGSKLGADFGRKRGAEAGYKEGFDRGFAEGRASVYDDDTQPSRIPTRRGFPVA